MGNPDKICFWIAFPGIQHHALCYQQIYLEDGRSNFNRSVGTYLCTNLLSFHTHTHHHKHIDKNQANEAQKPDVQERLSALGNNQHVLYRMMSVVGRFRPLNAPEAAVQ